MGEINIPKSNAVQEAVAKAGGLIPTAYRLEVHPNTINSWVRRKFVPKASYAKRLAKLSGFSVEALRPVGSPKC